MRALLLGAFVGLADGKAGLAKSAALLSLLLEVLGVRLGLVLRLGCGSILCINDFAWGTGAVAEGWVASSSVGSEAGLVVGLCLCDGLAGLLIVPLSIAVISTPSCSSLLLVVAAVTLVQAVSIVSRT